MLLPLVYHEDYVTPLPSGHRFPMPKFGLLRDHLLDSGLAGPEQFHTPSPATREQLEAVHDPAYVQGFCEGQLDHQAQRKIGLPWSEGLVRRTCMAVGGTLCTAQLALRHGLAANCAGGTHHAHPGHGSGFCIFNDLAVTAAVLLAEAQVDQVLIVDLDVHQGDGTAVIFENQPRVFTFSMHGASNFPMRKPPGDLDVPLPDAMDDAAYLETLADGHSPAVTKPAWPTKTDAVTDTDTDALGVNPPRFAGLEALVNHVEPDLVLYDAGVDVHHDDRLGRLALTDQGLYDRDRYVIQIARREGIPIACVIGGGYHANHRLLAKRHANLHWAASDVLAQTPQNTAH